MISFSQKDPSARLLKTFLPPFKGTWKTLPPYLLPEDTVQDSKNVMLHSGSLKARGGLKLIDRSDLGAPVIGSFLSVDTKNVKYPIAATKDAVYLFVNTRWRDITNNVALNASATHVRLSSLQIGTAVHTLYVNGLDTPKVISEPTYLLQSITPFQGSLPVLTDVCTSFSRFVGITPPYTVSWCSIINNQFPSFTNWPSTNQAILADTEDSVVAIRNLGTLGLVVYKEGNIFVGFAQAGAESQAFRFEHRGEYEGPASVYAIVNVEGTQMRMTPTGRIGLFDGTQNAWICDGIWPFLQDDLDTAFSGSIFGVYDYRLSQVTFWYPRKGDNGVCKGMIVICLPYATAGIEGFSYFLGQSNFACTNGLSVRLFRTSSSPFVFGNTNQTFQIDRDALSDNGYDFPCQFKTSLFRPQSDDSGQDLILPILELFTTRGANLAGSVDVRVLTSNLLEDDGIASEPHTVDLTQKPFHEFIAYDKDTFGSFLGVMCSWDSSSKFEYKGCAIYGRGVL